MKVVELFAGIGSQAKALQRVAKKRDFNVDFIKTCEWEIHAIVAYHYIHNKKPILDAVNKMENGQLIDVLSSLPISSNGKDLINLKYLKSLKTDILKVIYNSILENNNLLDVRNVKGIDVPNDVELMTYSFPCQDLSNVGYFHGYNKGIDKDKNTRSGLLWEVERILIEKKELGLNLPKFLLLENVTSLEAARHKDNFELWQKQLKELGYINRIYKLNSEDFGIPQYRRRLIMLSVYVGDDAKLIERVNKYWRDHDLNDKEYIKSLNIESKSLNSILKTNYKNKLFMKEALEAQPNATPSRLKIWNNNSKIIDENCNIASRAQTITTKQDRHPNSGNIYFNPENSRSRYRFLTPRECFLLMGFDEQDFEILIKNNTVTRKNSLFFSRDTLYKLAGNSIVVNVLEYVFNQLLDIKSIIQKKPIK